MTYDEIVAMVREYADSVELKNDNDHITAEVNITDKGVFSVELKDGKVNVEPNGCENHDIWVTTDSDTFLKLVNSKTNPVIAFSSALLKGKVKAGGDKKKALAYADTLKQVMKARAKAH